MPKTRASDGASQFDFSAFDDTKLRQASKLRPLLKYIAIAGVGGVALVSAIIHPSVLTPGLVLLAAALFVTYHLCSQTPGDIFARQNRLKKPFMRADSYYYFLYKEYQKAAQSALSKTSASPWGLPLGEGEFAITFFHNMDVLIWARLAKNFPHLVIDGTGNNRFLGNNIEHGDLPIEQVELEGNFPDYFKVYIEENQEALSLQILSPDRMATLVDNFAAFDLEIKENHLKLYAVNAQANSHSMRALISLLQKLNEDLKIERLNKIKTAPSQHKK